MVSPSASPVKSPASKRHHGGICSARFPTIAERLAVHGLSTISVAPDGNCLYRAVAVGFYGSEKKHLDVRSAVVAYVEANSDYFLEFYANNQEGDPNNLIQDLTDMRIPGSWGAELQLAAACRAVRRNITLLAPDYTTTYEAADPTGEPIHVIFDGFGHYSGTKKNPAT